MSLYHAFATRTRVLDAGLPSIVTSFIDSVAGAVPSRSSNQSKGDDRFASASLRIGSRLGMGIYRMLPVCPSE
jgi:hypothetical protein